MGMNKCRGRIKLTFCCYWGQAAILCSVELSWSVNFSKSCSSVDYLIQFETLRRNTLPLIKTAFSAKVKILKSFQRMLLQLFCNHWLSDSHYSPVICLIKLELLLSICQILLHYCSLISQCVLFTPVQHIILFVAMEYTEEYSRVTSGIVFWGPTL